MTREERGNRDLEAWLQGWKFRLERTYQKHSLGPAIYRKVDDYELKFLIPGTWLYGPKGGVIGRVENDGVVRRFVYQYIGGTVSNEPFHVHVGRLAVKDCDCQECAQYREYFIGEVA